MNALISRIRPMAAMVALAIVGSATAADVDMTGWVTYGGIATTTNTSTTIAVPAGSSGVSALSFSNLSFTAINGSYQSEFVIRVEVPGSTTAFWSIKPSSTAAGGTFTGSGTGTTFAGAPFTIPAGTSSLRVFVYESLNDGGDAAVDANVTSGTLTVTFGDPPPPFDACANATTAAVGANVLPMNATAPNLPVTCGTFGALNASKANYLKFVAPRTGECSVDSCAQTTDTIMSVLTTCGDSITEIACNDDFCDLASNVSFSAVAGQTYYIAVGMWSATTAPPATLTININICTSGFDACANQTVVTVGSNNIVVDCGAANLDLTGYWTPDFGDAAVGTANYVKFIAPATGLYEAALCGNESDSRLAVLTACGDSATFLAADDDGCTDGAPPFTSKVSWNATQGATYYVAVGCYVQAGVALLIPPDQVLTIGEPAAPVDPCDPSQIINASIGTTIVIPDQAFPDLDMTGSACAFEFGTQTINAPKYLKFTPSVSGTFTVGNCTDTGTTADCRIAALATCGDPSTTIACDDDGCTGGQPPFTSLLTLDLVSGVTYYFAVGGYSATQVGPFTIEITGPSAPPSCFADINLDGIVNGADLGLLLGNWGATGTGDLNNDGIVNGADLGLLLGAFGVCP
jgi:hypothetical protein